MNFVYHILFAVRGVCAMEDVPVDQTASWESLYGKKVWAKWKSNFWPCLCYDPSKLGHVKNALLQRSISAVGRRYTVRYLGMEEESAYGFIPKNDIRPYHGPDDPLLNQSPECMKKYAKAMEQGIALMRLEESETYEFHEARSFRRPRSSSKLVADEGEMDEFAASMGGDEEGEGQTINHVLLGGPVRVPRDQKSGDETAPKIKKKPGRKPKSLTIDTSDAASSTNDPLITMSSLGESSARKRGRPRKNPFSVTNPDHQSAANSTLEDGAGGDGAAASKPIKRRRRHKTDAQEGAQEGVVKKRVGRPPKRPKPDNMEGSQAEGNHKKEDVDEEEEDQDEDSDDDDDDDESEDDDEEESDYDDDDDDIRKPVRQTSARGRRPSKLTINDDDEDEDEDDDDDEGNGISTESKAEPSLAVQSSKPQQAEMSDDEKLTRYLQFLGKIVAQSDPVSEQQSTQVVRVIRAISKLPLVFTPELLKQVAVFGQLKNHTNQVIAAAAKAQVKLWKTQNADDISRLRRESTTPTSTTSATPAVKPDAEETTEALLTLPQRAESQPTAVIATETVAIVTEAETAMDDVPESELDNRKPVEVSVAETQTRVLPPLPTEEFNADLLPIPIRADIARRRAVKLLMSVSLPRQDVAVALEQNAYKIFVMSSSTYTAAPSESVLVTHKYTACITRLAFALLEPELQPVRNRLLRLTTVAPTVSGPASNGGGASMSEKEWHNLCAMDLPKLYAWSGY